MRKTFFKHLLPIGQMHYPPKWMGFDKFIPTRIFDWIYDFDFFHKRINNTEYRSQETEVRSNNIEYRIQESGVRRQNALFFIGQSFNPCGGKGDCLLSLGPEWARAEKLSYILIRPVRSR